MQDYPINVFGSAVWLNTARLNVALLFMALGISACGGGGGADTPPVPPPLPPAPTSAQMTMGFNGGTVSLASGAKIDVPKGVVPSNTTIAIEQTAVGAPVLPTGITLAGPMFSMTPQGTTFATPATVTIPFDASQVPAGQTPILLMTNAAHDGWEQVFNTTQTANTLTGKISHFSYVSTLAINYNVRIIGQPRSLDVPEGGFAIFRVDAVSRYPDVEFRYQWSGGRFTDAGTFQDVLIRSVELRDNPSLIRVVVTALVRGVVVDTVTSDSALLTVIPNPPFITQAPQSISVTASSNATFTVAATGAGLTYQWRRGAADAPGASTGSSYTFNNAQLTDSGSTFTAVVRNGSGIAVESGAATLTVTPIETVPVIAQAPQSVSVRAGQSASFTVRATGTNLSYEWERSINGGAFAVVTGTSATYTISNVAAGSNGDRYRVRVFNNAGTITSTPPATLTVVPGAALALTRVSGGDFYSVGLRGNGTLTAWGDAGANLGIAGPLANGVPGDVNVGANIATFATGIDHAMAIKSDGIVWSWGLNSEGQLGNGNQQRFRVPPAAIAGVALATHVAVGAEFSVVALADGHVRAWGNNDAGQLGDGTYTRRLTAGEVPNLTNVRSVAAGYAHALALKTDGTVWAWGYNNAGQLGDGTSVQERLLPVPVVGLTNIVSITACGWSSFAIASDGTLYGWGNNSVGQLGVGILSFRMPPVVVQLAPPIVSVACGPAGTFALALKDDGTVWAWGANNFGQLGNGTRFDVRLPTSVSAPLPPNIQAIGAGSNHGLALAPDGSVWGWGLGANGTLGVLASDPSTPRTQPIRIQGVNLN